MSTRSLSELARLAVGATTSAPAVDTLVRAMEVVRSQTGAVAAILFYGGEAEFAGCGVGDDPAYYPQPALRHLQQRLVHFRVPLAFNLADEEVRFITRAENKQRRDYMAWLVPTADSWTELLILRGTWPESAVAPLLEFVGSAMPAITMMLERFVGVGHKERLERQLATISTTAEALSRSAEVIGSVAAAYPELHGLPEDQVNLLKTLADEGAEAVAEVRAHRDLIAANLRLQEYTARLERIVQAERQQATTDALTGLRNHRGALQALEAAVESAGSESQPVSLVMADVDGFKLFNDTYGHVMGDEVLKLVADVTRKAARPSDTICRYGGDEFLMVLPGKSRRSATRLARRMTERLGRAEFRTESQSLVPIRMSLGIASFPEDGTSAAKLVATADAAMYEAKRRARGKDDTSISTGADTSFGVLESLILVVDAKDRYTKDHCDLVAEYAVKLAERMNLSDESRRPLRIAGLLHDVGKLVVPDHVLKKPGPLTIEEYDVMQTHVRIGEVLIREVPQLKDVIQAVSCHHERYDGSGYPRGLKGDEIPLLGRIIAIADAYSAMCLDRPYRKAMSHDRILEELVAGAGIQFDPSLVRVFIELLLEEQLEKQRAVA